MSPSLLLRYNQSIGRFWKLLFAKYSDSSCDSERKPYILNWMVWPHVHCLKIYLSSAGLACFFTLSFVIKQMLELCFGIAEVCVLKMYGTGVYVC